MEIGQIIGAGQHEMPLAESTATFKATDDTNSGEQEVQGFAKTLAFLRAAIAEGAHLNKPPHGSISEDVWVRQKNIVGVYFGSPATLEEIGEMYNITYQMVTLI